MTTNNNIPSAGTIDVVLHPGDLVTLNQSTLVTFGVPFPKCVVNDVSNIRVLNIGLWTKKKQVCVIFTQIMTEAISTPSQPEKKLRNG